jgi:MFS family permease
MPIPSRRNLDTPPCPTPSLYHAPLVLSNFTDHLQDPNIVWVALSYTLTSAVTLTIIGRVSDIFGRRWVFVGGAALGVLGAIICSVAQNVTTLIVGTTIMGIAAATQLSYFYVLFVLHSRLGYCACYFNEFRAVLSKSGVEGVLLCFDRHPAE